MWPLLSPRCTCVSALVLSQYQQAVFHHSVREAHGIRAESTQNNYTELRDNTEPKHQRETGGHCFVHHPAGIRPKEKQCVAIVEVHWHTHTHKKKIEQDVMSFCAWGHRWPTVSPACECASATAIRRAHLIFETRWHRGLRAALLYIMSPITYHSNESVAVAQQWCCSHNSSRGRVHTSWNAQDMYRVTSCSTVALLLAFLWREHSYFLPCFLINVQSPWLT